MPRPTPAAELGPRSRAAEAGRLLLAARLSDVQRLLRAAAGGRSASAVHDLRVSCRRLRVALELFAQRPGRLLADRVKELQDALGAVRDLHVQSAWLGSLKLPRLQAFREVHLPARAAALDRALREFRARTAPGIEEAIGALEGKGRLQGKPLRKELAGRLRKLRARLLRARSVEPEAAHRLRIAAKRLRYQLELLGPAFPRAAKGGLDELPPLQDALGELHDADARLDVLRPFLDGASEDEVAPALAALAALLAERDELGRSAAREIKRWRKRDLADQIASQL